MRYRRFTSEKCFNLDASYDLGLKKLFPFSEKFRKVSKSYFSFSKEREIDSGVKSGKIIVFKRF